MQNAKPASQIKSGHARSARILLASLVCGSLCLTFGIGALLMCPAHAQSNETNEDGRRRVGAAFARSFGSFNQSGRNRKGFGIRRQEPDRFWLGKGEMVEKQIMLEGVTRQYFVYTPANALAKQGKPLPLVMMFHGGGGTAKGADRSTGGITKTADKYGFMMVFAQGVDRHWNDGRPDLAKHYYDDVAFTGKIIDSLVAEGRVDQAHVYSTGISNGGFFSQYLAMSLPNKIAAVATVGASVSTNFQSLPIKKPLPIMLLLGTEDTLIPWEGGLIGGKVLRHVRGEVMTGRQSVDFWRARNENKATADRLPLPDINKRDKCSVFVEKYGLDGDSNQVILVEIQGGGHTWPSGQQYLPAKIIGPVCRDFDGNEMIWDFFSKHSL